MKYKDLHWTKQYDFDVSNLITEARVHAGLTQEQLAKKMGTKQPAVARLEAGSYLPSHATMKKLAKAVGMKLVAPKLVPLTSQ